jgi:hypothetical protein
MSTPMMALAFSDDHVPVGAAISLADCGAGGPAYPGPDDCALATSQFVTKYCTRGAADCAANCRVTAIVKICARGERRANEQSKCGLPKH